MITGLHHISMKCATPEEFQQVEQFYRGVLGLKLFRRWQGGMLLDTGSGMIEVFLGPNGEHQKGVLRHVALETDDVDGCVRAVIQAGYPVILEPQDKTFPSEPPFSMRIAFCKGPLGEEIEFFCPSSTGDSLEDAT